MDNKEKQQREEWIKNMLETLKSQNYKTLKDELYDYYNLIQTNQKVIYLLSKGKLSKQTYTFEVFKEFYDERTNELIDKIDEINLSKFLEENPIEGDYSEEELLSVFCEEIKSIIGKS